MGVNWTFSNEIIVKDNQLKLEGSEGLTSDVDLRGAFSLRLSGEIQRLPENITEDELITFLIDREGKDRSR